MSINRKIDGREGNVSEETRFGTLSHSEEIEQNSCINRVRVPTRRPAEVSPSSVGLMWKGSRQSEGDTETSTWPKARERPLDPGVLELVKWAMVSSSQPRISWHFQYRYNFLRLVKIQFSNFQATCSVWLWWGWMRGNTLGNPVWIVWFQSNQQRQPPN